MIQHKICFLDLGSPPKGPLEGKLFIFNKMCNKNNRPFKNHGIVVNIEKSVLGVNPRGFPPDTKF